MRQTLALDGCPACMTTTVKTECVLTHAETPSNPTKEMPGDDQGTRGLREGRGDGCHGRR
jgi:hypothetical protein